MRLIPLLRRLALAAPLAGLIAFAAIPVAQAQQIQIIKDAETETLVRNLARPILNVAGMAQVEPRIYIVNDRRFNAFVVEGGDIFVNYGTILDVDTPNQLQAILAHEIAHLAGGHLARLRQQANATAIVQIAALALGVGAAAAGSAAGVGQVGGLASAFILASQSAGVNSLLAFQRSEESAADAQGLKFLERAGKSTRGLVEVLNILNDSTAIVPGSSPFLMSHPLPADRLAQVTQEARASSTWNRQDSAADLAAFHLVQGKITGFMESAQTTMGRYPNSDKSLAARYARVITAYKSGAGISSVQIMPGLIADEPSNPYFHELYGQMLLETGQPQKAITELRKAVDLATDQPEIRQMYGLALIQAGGTGNLTEAVDQLNRAARELQDPAPGYAMLSRAYAGLGQQGEASLAAAQAAFARGDKGTALGLAKQAQQKLNPGSPAWLRADDILNLQ